MNILLDDSLVCGASIFAPYGALRVLPAGAIDEEAVAWADVLCCRSKVSVDEQLIGQQSLRFVGTATAGLDHMNQPLLRSRHIPFAAAVGCNAESVADYVSAAFCKWLLERNQAPHQLRAGIVGYGHIGRIVAQRMRALGLPLNLSDPPLAAQWQKTPKMAEASVQFEPLARVLEADVVSLHVPLVTAGAWPTRHLLGDRQLAAGLQPKLLLSCGRGETVATEAFTRWCTASDHAGVVDVWETEPEVDMALLDAAWLATPHIAGYSLDGRINATLSVRDSMLSALKLPRATQGAEGLPELNPPPILDVDISGIEEALALVVKIYDPGRDHQHFLKRCAESDRAQAFAGVRKNYWSRRDFRCIRIAGAGGEAARVLGALGFQLQ